MLYALLLIGLLFIFYGWNKATNERIPPDGEFFKELIHTQGTEKREYIEILSLNHELKTSLDQMNEKIDGILDKICREEEGITVQKSRTENYNRAAEVIEKMLYENKSIDEIAESLNMAKGEVLLLKRLLTK